MIAEIEVRFDSKKIIQLSRFDYSTPKKINMKIKQEDDVELSFYIDLPLARKIFKSIEAMLQGQHGKYEKDSLFLTIEKNKIK